MTVTAIPVASAGATGARVLRGSRPAPYIAASGDRILPGCYGISRGGSITGDLIRPATGARAGHAFIYVGNGHVVEAAPPAARISPAASHPEAIWNVRCPLTAAQRDRILQSRGPLIWIGERGPELESILEVARVDVLHAEGAVVVARVKTGEN